MLGSDALNMLAGQQLYPDTGAILAYTEGASDAYGYTATTYTAGAAFACSFNELSPKEQMQGAQVEAMDAVARVPSGTTVTIRERSKLTKRLQQTITAITYEIVGIEERGPFGLVLKLQRVTDGSD